MKYYDVIIIGSGPSGLMACSNIENKSTLILEKNNTLGGKLKVSGGGRCNITNNKSIEGILSNIPKNNKFLYSSLNNFGPQNIINFFEKKSLKLKEENDNKIFPDSDKSQDVINVFINILKKKNNISVQTNYTVKSIQKTDEQKFIVDNTYLCSSLVIATGGITYPHLGTTGDGFNFAKNLGHSITELFPTETPLVSNDPIIQSKILQGISLKNIRGSVIINKKKVFSKEHDLLITHFGLSGPLALQSSFFIKNAIRKNIKDIKLTLDFTNYNNIPKKLRPYINENELSLNIHGTRGKKFGFVTDGGVSLKEINPKNFQSKIQENLFFIGEVLDINCFTGGYNITSCLSEGYAVASYINGI